MRKKHNLKKRMLIKEKKPKFISVVKKITCLSTLALMILSIINPQILAYANLNQNINQILKTNIEYNEDYGKANIKFDINSIDSEIYEITSITSDNDGKVVYDKNKATKEDKEVKYEAIENGSYSFTIKYLEKIKKEVPSIVESTVENTENTTVEGKKEEKIIIDISKIKKAKTEQVKTEQAKTEQVKTEQVKTELDLNEEKKINESEIFKSNSEKDNTINNEFKETKSLNSNQLGSSSINLEENFSYSGVKTGYNGHDSTNITKDYFKIKDNKIILGKKDSHYINQTIFLKSNYKLDFNRNFILKGILKYDFNVNGFTISFHDDKNYIAKNTNATLGIYSGKGISDIWDTTNWANNKGLSNAVVVEVDNIRTTSFIGDYFFGDDLSNSEHVQILETNEIGHVNRNSIVNKDFEKYRFMDIYNKFSLEWNSKTNTMNFILGEGNDEIRITKNNFENIRNLKEKGAYLSFSGCKVGSDSSIDLEFSDIRYTDIEPEVKTEFDIKSPFPSLGDKFVVKHTLFNNNYSTTDIDVPLYLEDFSVYDKDNIGDKTGKMKLNIDGKIQYSYTGGISDSEWKDFADQESLKNGRPLMIKLPKNKQKMYLRYNAMLPQSIRNPEYKDYGASYEIKNVVLVGEKGMSQFKGEARKDIVTKPAIWSEKEGVSNKKYEKEIIKVNSKADITKENMWKGIKAKASHHSVKSLDNSYRQAIPKDVKVKNYDYFTQNIDGTITNHNQDFPNISDNIVFYGLNITVEAEGLINTFTTRFALKQVVEDNNLIINAKDFSVSETKLNTIHKDNFNDFILSESEFMVSKINEEGGIIEIPKSSITVNSTGWINNKGYAYKKPSIYSIKISVSDQGKVINKTINVNVTENTWSYDTPNRTEENGASGFIVIPKGINMNIGKGNDKDKLVAEGDVFFANYNTKNASYKLYVDKEFKLTKTDDAANKINVISSAPRAEDKGNNRLFIDTMNFRYHKGNPLKIKFSAERSKENKIKGRWNGNVTFYFERVN